MGIKGYKMKKYLFIILSSLFLTACAGNVNHSWCPSVEEVKAQAPIAYENQTIQLSADALFKFNKAGINDLLPKGRSELDDLIYRLKSNYVTVKQIDITGHTDRLGSDLYNMKLGMERAETISKYLVNNDIHTTLNISSQGKRQPITTSCIAKDGLEALKACLQPDRRIEVRVIGIKIKQGHIK